MRLIIGKSNSTKSLRYHYYVLVIPTKNIFLIINCPNQNIILRGGRLKLEKN